MDYKNKYLLYKNKYFAFKKKMMQRGGNIDEIYQYLEENIRNINPHYFQIIQEFADSLIQTNPTITVPQFISNVNSIYGIVLPNHKHQMTHRPTRHVSSNDDFLGHTTPTSRPTIAQAQSNESLFMDLAGSPHVMHQFREHAATAAPTLITVYTTGIAYFESNNITQFVRALIENIVETCERKRVRFIHYDMFDNLIPRYYRDERFVHGYLTLDIIQSEIENNPNALLVDLAHVISYEKNRTSSTPIMRYTQRSYTESSIISRPLNINCFYTGFMGDMQNINFIRNFKFFQFEGNNIITWIKKGIQKNIKIREIYRGDTTTFIDFTSNYIDISGNIANVRRPEELNRLFWQ